MDLARFDLILRVRVFASAILFAIFVAVGLHGVLAGWHFGNPTPAVVLLVLAFFSWPRRARPKGWKPEDPESTQGRQQLEARRILRGRFSRVRMYYFFAAVFLLLFLPWLLGEPVFQLPA